MKTLTTYVANALILLVLATSMAAAQSPAPSPADKALAVGNFDGAASAYAAALAADPNDADAELGIGTIELFRNHVDEARAHLRRALALAPNSRIARANLGAIDNRTGGPDDYRVAFTASQARIPFDSTDPLPTFKARIDGVPVTLVIDTGAPELSLSEATVERLHLATKAAGEGVFAGGLRARIRSVRIDRFEVPGLSVMGIPGGVIPGSGDFHGIDGVVGTDFLYHFLATIDYAHKALVLRPKGDSAAYVASAKAAGAALVPMWLAGDHFIFVRARVNGAPNALYNIDSGGPGVGVDLTKSTLAAADITPDAAHPRSFRGGGGQTEVLPFTAATVTMGDVVEHDLPGIYVPSGGMDGLFPFAVAGRISHEFFRHKTVTFDFESMTLVVASS